MQFERSFGFGISVFEGEVEEVIEFVEFCHLLHILFDKAIPPHEGMSCGKIRKDKCDPFSIREIGDCGEVETGGDHEGVILGLVSIKGFRFVDLDFVVVSQHGFRCNGFYWGWCCKGNGWRKGWITGACDGGGLVDQEVFFCGEVDSTMFNVIVIEFSGVKDMSFWDNFPNVSSGVFDVTDVSCVELISVGVSSVTPPDEGWEWGWDRRCHSESLRVSKSLS